MESDLLAGWAKQAPLYRSEIDVLLSERPRARSLSQALGEPPMTSGGEMSQSHSPTPRKGRTIFDCDTASVVLSFSRCPAGPFLGADFCSEVFGVEECVDMDWVTV